ncbi:hypothetical protein QET40_00930 [Akkermansia sp. N21169]|nr:MULTISPECIES: hypothetical protein [unclassified Akkermansia]MDH3067663.1 hypothetical protein [Akkermansia sp. N21169]WPX39488.1 hypothetical protein QET93_008050 [Akkermansia sp. N21116]
MAVINCEVCNLPVQIQKIKPGFGTIPGNHLDNRAASYIKDAFTSA